MHLLAAAVAVVPNLPTSWELAARIILAGVLGALIGLERELNDHPSGMRTHVAVAIGSALFGITSAYAFTEFIALRADNNYSIDPTRIAAQVVTGVGFLGGGAIIKQGNTVKGLTSAAGLWVSAAVGLAVSLGMYIEATVATVFLLLALVALKMPIRALRHHFTDVVETVVINIALDADPSGMVTALGSLPDTTIRSITVKRREDDAVTSIEVQFEGRTQVLQSTIAVIESYPEVLSVETS